MTEYVFTYSTGMCRTATDNAGTVFHAVAVEDADAYPASFASALCGRKPGKRSNGWSDYRHDSATCPKCIKKLEANK